MSEPMRVLQVVTHMNRGGLETMLMNYYRCIDRNEIQFDFLTHRPYDGDYGEEIKRMGGKIFHLSTLNPFSISYKKALKSFFSEHPEYKVVHVHQDCMSSVILKEAKSCGVPVRIAHSHGSSQDKNLKYLVKLFYKQYIPKYSTNLLACGIDAGRWMFGNSTFEVLKNAINASEYTFNPQKRAIIRNAYGIDEDTLVIGHVGRFSPPKNHEKLINIFAAILKNKKSILLLVGDGALRPMIEDKVTQLGLQNYVFFMGLRTDVADLLQAMDVFVFPSLYEGLPVTIIEAQAAGLPCVISDKVPVECKITDLVYQLSIRDSGLIWGDKIVQLSEISRYNRVPEIRKAGYDVEYNAKKLEEFYFATLKNRV